MRKIENMKWWPQLLRQRDTHSLRRLSELYGVSPSDISAALRRAGRGALSESASFVEELPPEPGEELTPPRTAAPARAPTRRSTVEKVKVLHAWKLIFQSERSERVILADTAVEAARVASRLGAEVIGIRDLGQVVQ